MDEKKQIEEMAKIVDEVGDFVVLGVTDAFLKCKIVSSKVAKKLYNANYRKQSEGEWVANPHISISKRGRTIHYATFKCSVCGKWNGRKKQKYCSNCGAKMKGGAE